MPEDPQHYRVYFTREAGEIEYHVLGCWGGEKNRTNIRIHFLHLQMQNTLVIMEEGNLPHHWCLYCDMFTPWAALNRRHQTNVL